MKEQWTVCWAGCDWRGSSGSAGRHGERCCRSAQRSSTHTHLPAERPAPDQGGAALSVLTSPASRDSTCLWQDPAGWDGSGALTTRGLGAQPQLDCRGVNMDVASGSRRLARAGVGPGDPDRLHGPPLPGDGLRSPGEVWTRCSRKEGL